MQPISVRIDIGSCYTFNIIESVLRDNGQSPLVYKTTCFDFNENDIEEFGYGIIIKNNNVVCSIWHDNMTIEYSNFRLIYDITDEQYDDIEKSMLCYFDKKY